MRILLATEGETDEVVAKRLLGVVFPNAVVQPKRMPARGFGVLTRLLADIVRAAHFGHFELLVVHFDLDDTFLEAHQHVRESERWRETREEVERLIAELGSVGGRSASLHTAFMTPAQSTDAWLRWAFLDGDGKRFELMNRHTLKRAVFGNPPRGLLEKAVACTEALLIQMANCDRWPRSLRDFQDELDVVKKRLESVN